MNQMEIFENSEFGTIRIITEGDRYLFCGMDVAAALGYAKPRNALAAHCRYALKRGVPHPQSAGRTISMIFIPEGDVYRLIVHSKLPNAEKFESWVFDEVLPSIRRHGAYVTMAKLTELISSPVAALQLYADLAAERQKNSALQKQNESLRDKATYFEAFVETAHCTSLRITAKELQVPEHRFVRFLLGQEYVYRSPAGAVLPYTKPENEGLFCVKDYFKNGRPGSYTLITPQGKQLFSGLRKEILETI